ncbi:MAG: single-stranded-DNA-specific exonuclease RecJ [Leptolyngbya sp. SIO4C1]|nr:single-stranded-DNA-specific exonuclease RecJ [Leptolyngbya sp. SIO4C1]
MTPAARWQIIPSPDLPDDWVQQVQTAAQLDSPPHFGAQLLWQRGIRTAEQLKGFLDPAGYQPASPFAFGPEMALAVARLVQACDRAEKVAIWGDFDADGVTSTAVLWEGLGQFFTPHTQLTYYIPNRLIESHGLSPSGLDRLAAEGVRLIVTCDTGSTDLSEILYAQQLGMEIIVTDHHTLLPERPPVVAIINPRSLPIEHPLANLSGVAVAFKLVEALYERLPERPQQPLSQLTDLVAIGLIADLVELTGDCRYLAQVGIQQLQRQAQPASATRPGVAQLLALCRRTGDRPTDISFGLGPRINAVSRIHGDASFCVELLTSRDPERCRHLAEQTELANARRKALQHDLQQQVAQRLEALDLATTGMIVLADPQWPTGVLGIVAGQIAQQYGKPTVLLTLDEAAGIARGSARSVNQIDLYQLVAEQAHLLTGFGGHPFAAGMSLPIENLPLFADAVNRQLRGLSDRLSEPVIAADLKVSVSDLGRPLFQQLNLLEPCGMGNPAPRLLIADCWFGNTWHQKIKDPASGRKLQYIKTSFLLKDASSEAGFPGVWWGHYKDDLPPGRCDVIAELDFNSFSKRQRPRYGGYEIRLVDIRPAQTGQISSQPASADRLVDCRVEPAIAPDSPLVLAHCPSDWQQLRPWWHQATPQQPLVLAYPPPGDRNFVAVWKTLLGLAKYLSRTGQAATPQQLCERLQMAPPTLELGLKALAAAGFEPSHQAEGLMFDYRPEQAAADPAEAIRLFLSAVREEQFRQRYFYQVPVATAQAVMSQL